VLVTGSAAFVTDHADWSERSAAWLRQTAHDDLPVFGICYGHQLLAHALGGEVAYNPAGRESGTIELELQPQAAQDPLFQGLPQHFAAHATHLQTVLRAPTVPRCWPVRRWMAAMPSAGAARPGACSSIRSSPPTTCVATCVPAPTASAATAAAPAASSARSAPRRWPASCCAASSARRGCLQPSRRQNRDNRRHGQPPGPSCPSRMSMKEIRKLPASAGAQWLLDTFSLYRRAPLQLARIGLTWLLVSWVVTLLSTLIPGAAGMAVQLMTLAISPIMFGGMLYAVGEIDEGRPGLASHLLQPIRDHRVSHLLVPLAIQVLAVLLLGALLFLMIGREGFTAFSEVMTKMEEISRSGQQIKPDDAAALVANLPAKRIALWMLLVFLSAVALSLAMFTQPALVVFDKQSGMHALRLSLQGCIENIGAMIVFAALGLIAAFCMYILFVIVIQIAMLIGGPLAAAFIAQLVLTTVLMPLYVGAVYAAWKQMFVHRGSRAAPPIPTTPTSSDVFHA
jgi:hypothetical protein